MTLPLPKDNIIVNEQKQPERGIKLNGRLMIQPGMKYWWFDPCDGRLEEIQIHTKANVSMKGQVIKNAMSMVPDNTVIIPAINRKNAQRKADKYMKSQTK
jgi:hypothetical protein